MKFDTITSAIKEIKAGGMVVVLDNEDRENEGDLVMASDAVTPANINFMAKEGRGLICISVSKPRAKKLDLEPMEQKNTSLHETAFTVSVDAIKEPQPVYLLLTDVKRLRQLLAIKLYQLT